MRIVHLSHSDIQGGAARAADRLVRGLRLIGVECDRIVKHKQSRDSQTWAAVPTQGHESQHLVKETDLVRKYYIERHRTPLSNTYFSLPLPSCGVAELEEVRRADVVNLHWISGLLSPVEVGRIQSLGKPVVWTLHDQRAFTGGCHYSAGCRNYENDCQHCPQLENDDLALAPAALRESLTESRAPIAVVSPSKWLADCAARSALFRSARISVIPYGLDTDVFKPGRAEARKHLQWDPAAVYLLFGAENIYEARKGFDLLRAAVRTCLAQGDFQKAVTEGKIRFVFFGNARRPPAVEFPAQWMGGFESDADLARLYAACDAFILPSREDNLPNTMLEAMCCGTPVFGFKIGGLPDVIDSGNNGLLAAPEDIPGLAAAIRSLSLDPALRARLAENCRSKIPSRFGLRTQAEHYQRLYEDEITRQAKERRGAVAAGETKGVMGPAFSAVFPALLNRARRERRAAPLTSIKKWLTRPTNKLDIH
jgi:glycosyltransferase involved in cell wall biosynthesis